MATRTVGNPCGDPDRTGIELGEPGAGEVGRAEGPHQHGADRDRKGEREPAPTPCGDQGGGDEGYGVRRSQRVGAVEERGHPPRQIIGDLANRVVE
jgi:hypothetical protein